MLFLSGKTESLKSFLFLRKIMILWLGVYFTYLGMQYVNPGINSTVIEILLNISLAFMIMARSLHVGISFNIENF